MDHHCPWLNNCVGFRNRKIFILLITYAFIFCIFATFAGLYPIIYLFRHGFSPKGRYFSMVISVIGMVFAAFGIYVMWGFVSYHFELAAHNKTTLEEMDRKRGSTPPSYDVGSELNWKFIFGNNKFCWPIPYDKGIAAPLGDGVVVKTIDNMSEVAGGSASRQNLDDVPIDGKAEENWNANAPNDPLNQFNANSRNNF